MTSTTTHAITSALALALLSACGAAPLTLRQRCDGGDPDACFSLRLQKRPPGEETPEPTRAPTPKPAPVPTLDEPDPTGLRRPVVAPANDEAPVTVDGPETPPADAPQPQRPPPPPDQGPCAMLGGIVTKMPDSLAISAPDAIERNAVQAIINRDLGKMQRCYEAGLADDPDLRGRMELEWVIAADGSVRTARMSAGDLTMPKVVSCVVRVVESWRFARARGPELVVTYPLYFRSFCAERR